MAGRPPARIAGRFASLLGVAENALDLVSPQTYASTLPPTIIFCGDEGSVTPPQLSIDLHKAIRAAGGVCDLCLFSHLIHEFVSLPGMMETTVRDAVEFFDRTAVNKSRFNHALSELHETASALGASGIPIFCTSGGGADRQNCTTVSYFRQLAPIWPTA